MASTPNPVKPGVEVLRPKKLAWKVASAEKPPRTYIVFTPMPGAGTGSGSQSQLRAL
jgi:hypothetical protein